LNRLCRAELNLLPGLDGNMEIKIWTKPAGLRGRRYLVQWQVITVLQLTEFVAFAYTTLNEDMENEDIQQSIHDMFIRFKMENESPEEQEQ